MNVIRKTTWASLFLALIAGCGAGVDDSLQSQSEEEVRTRVGISAPLTLSAQSITPNNTLTASVTYKNNGRRSVTLNHIVIAGRRPGGTHDDGPFDDFAPIAQAVTLAGGQSITLSASRAFAQSDPAGRWEAYPTYEDSAGVWHDGPSVYFTVNGTTGGGGGGENPPPTPTPTQRMYGVTVDSVTNLSDIVTSLSKLSHRPTTRIVIDRFQPTSAYKAAVDQIHPISDIMIELVDSFYLKDYSLAQYKALTTEYLDAFADKVALWEVGNEINGEWGGAGRAEKMVAAYDLVKARNLKTELTLYYNEACVSRYDQADEMFKWAQANVPERMKQGLDAVLVSYYEDHCNDAQPNWPAAFKKLGEMFPNSKIGFGEVGTQFADRKVSYIQRYYQMKIDHPRYVGGYFWWYFKQDMVPQSKPLWTTLNNALLP